MNVAPGLQDGDASGTLSHVCTNVLTKRHFAVRNIVIEIIKDINKIKH